MSSSNILSAPDDIEMEDLNYYYASYSRCVSTLFISLLDLLSPFHRIYNDVITLREGSSYM